MKNIAFEIVKHGTQFACVRQPSGLILFVRDTEAECRAYFMSNRGMFVR